MLKGDEPVLLRSEALELMKKEAGQDFGYNPEKTATENRAALEKVAVWVESKAGKK